MLLEIKKMAIKITKDIIKQKVDLLHKLLPNPPIPINEIYKRPKHLEKKVIDTNYSDQSVQLIADSIGYYLGIIEPVQVRIFPESSEFMLRSKNDKDDQKVGL